MFEFLIALLFIVEQDADGRWNCYSADVADEEVEGARDGTELPDDREKHRERRLLKHFQQEAEACEWADRRRKAAARLLKDGQPTMAGDNWWVWADGADEQSWQSETAAGALHDAAEALAEKAADLTEKGKPEWKPSGSLSL